MLLHSCISVRSTESAENLFKSVLRLSLAYRFDIERETMRQLFHRDSPAHVHVYNAGNCMIEVFIMPDMPDPGDIQHLCFDCKDREAVIRRALSHGMNIRRYARETGDVIFIQDKDGNLIELKEASGR